MVLCERIYILCIANEENVWHLFLFGKYNATIETLGLPKFLEYKFGEI